MKKKHITLLLALAISATMITACGSKETNESSKEEMTSSESLSTESIDEKPSEDVSESLTEDCVIESEDTTEEDTQEVFDEELPSVKSDEKIDAIFTAVREKLADNYYPNMPIEAIFLQDMYGIDLTTVEAAFGEMPMISANVDTFIAIKAVSGQVDAVKGALETYLKSQQENAFQYPINVPVVQNAEVYVNGDYVFYICLAGDTMPLAEKGDEAIGNHVKQIVSDVKTVIDENLK
jgi:hypothetical protein